MVILLIGGSLFAEKTTESYRFKGNSFHFEMGVHSPLPDDSLFELLCSDSATYTLRGSASEIQILANKQIETTFEAFGYKAVTITEKKIEPDRTIRVTVKSFSHNWKIVPQVKSGEGVYVISPESNGSKVIYSQDVELNRPLSWLTERLIRWQLSPFGRDLRKLVQR